jgi:hypothetical protein
MTIPNPKEEPVDPLKADRTEVVKDLQNLPPELRETAETEVRQTELDAQRLEAEEKQQ